MLIPLLLLVLLVSVALVQSMHGWFSAMITMVLSICAATLAFGMYDWVAVNWIAPNWRPDYAHAIALASLFGVPLLIARILTDKLIRRACLIPSMLDRIGGGICGLITALIVVGVSGHAIANVPFGSSIMGFMRVPVADREQKKDGPVPEVPAEDAIETGLWLKSDRFTAGLASAMSAGVFSGDHLLSEDQPDLVQSIAWVNCANPGIARTVPPGSISIVSTAPLEFLYDWKPAVTRGNIPEIYDTLTAPTGSEYRMVRVALHEDAKDSKRSHLFTIRQFRLVGELGVGGPLRQYYAIATQEADASKPVNRHIRKEYWQGEYWPVTDTIYSPRDDNNNEVEVVFEIPDNLEPVFLEYKRGARVALSFSNDAGTPKRNSTSDAPTTDASKASPTTTKLAAAPKSPKKNNDSSGRRSRRSRRSNRNNKDTVADSGRGGNVRGQTANAGKSYFGGQLLVAIPKFRNVRNVERQGNKLISGHLVADISNSSEKTTGDPLTKLDVPANKRLLQLNTTRLNALSFLGKALDFAKQTIQNFWVEDSHGIRYKIIGKYAIADVNNKRMMEVQYFPNQAGTIGGLGKFQTVKDANLKGDYQLVLLFLVDPGVTITSFSTGGAATRRDDLTQENLVAPK